MQGMYAAYLADIRQIQTWYYAIFWLAFGNLGMCMVFWHTGTPLPSFFSHQTIAKSKCTYIALYFAVAILLVAAVFVAILIEAATVRQIAGTGASAVLLFSSPRRFIHGIQD